MKFKFIHKTAVIHDKFLTLFNLHPGSDMTRSGTSHPLSYCEAEKTKTNCAPYMSASKFCLSECPFLFSMTSVHLRTICFARQQQRTRFALKSFRQMAPEVAEGNDDDIIRLFTANIPSALSRIYRFYTHRTVQLGGRQQRNQRAAPPSILPMDFSPSNEEKTTYLYDLTLAFKLL